MTGLALTHWTKFQCANCWNANSKTREKQIWITYLEKNPTMASCRKRSSCLQTCHPKLWEWHFMSLDTWDLDCTSIRTLQRHPTPSSEEGPVGCCWQQCGDDYNLFLLHFSLSFFPPLFLFLSLSHKHLLLNKILAIDFGIWSHFYFNSGRVIFNNQILILFQK